MPFGVVKYSKKEYADEGLEIYRYNSNADIFVKSLALRDFAVSSLKNEKRSAISFFYNSLKSVTLANL